MPNLGPSSATVAVAADYVGRLTNADMTVVGVFSQTLRQCFVAQIPDAAGTVNYDFVSPEKIQILSVTVIKRNGAGAGNTIKMTNVTAATDITEAMACAVDATKTANATLVSTSSANVIAAGGVLRATVVRAAGTSNLELHVDYKIIP